MITKGQIPQLPLPCDTNIVGRNFVMLRKKHYIIDVWPHWSDGELVWSAYVWNGHSWPKLRMRTRAEENKFPKTIAKEASNFLEYVKLATHNLIV